MPNLEIPFVQLSPLQAKALVELIGTLVYVMTACLAEMEAGAQAVDGTVRLRNLAPLAVGFTLASLVFSFGYVSGGHFNPAVTFGVMLVDAIRIELAAVYVVAQVVGGFIGALVAALITPHGKVPAPSIFDMDKVEFIFRGFLGEALLTGTLVTVVLHTTCSKQKNNHHYGMAIGMYMMCALYAVGGMTHGAFNPAAATGMQLMRCIGGECEQLLHVWLYWAAPAAGTFVATIAYKMLHPKVQRVDPDDHGAALY